MELEYLGVLLSQRKDDYIKRYPRSAAIDLWIIESLLSGKEIKQIAQMVYYDPSYIYKRVKRIRAFLSETPEEELDLSALPCYMAESVTAWPAKGFSLIGFHVFHMLIALRQFGRSSVRGSELAKYHPSLRYVQRREEILEEMRYFELIVRNEKNKHVRVFESVEYVKHYYVFEITKEAAQYLGL